MAVADTGIGARAAVTPTWDTDLDAVWVDTAGSVGVAADPVVTAAADNTGVEDTPVVAAVEETSGVEGAMLELTGTDVAAGLGGTDRPDFTRVAAEVGAAADRVGGVAARPGVSGVKVGDPVGCRDAPRVLVSGAVGPWLTAVPPGGAAAATPDPTARAAPTPRVSAPTPSQAYGCRFGRRRRALVEVVRIVLFAPDTVGTLRHTFNREPQPRPDTALPGGGLLVSSGANCV